MITAKDLNEALGQILTKTGVTDIKTVLGTYDQAKPVKENLRLLLNHKKDILLETVNFLKTLGTEYPVPIQQINPKSYLKEDYAKDIVSFLSLLKPTQCLSCKENYVPTGDDFKENTVKCLICKRPSHHLCYKDSSVNPDIGIVFLCSECLSEKTAKDLEENDKKSSEPPSQPPTPAANPTKGKQPRKNDEDASDDEKEQPKDPPQKSKPSGDKKTDSDDKDCPLYLKRICPHGLTGKRLIDGKPCPHKHRKHCRYFLEYGPSGCRFKSQCRFLHPRVCENSLKLKTCLNKSCSEFHLKGTQRKPPPPEDYSNPPQQPKERNVQPWNFGERKLATEDKPANNIHQQSQSTNSHSKDFLDQYLHQIKADLRSFTQTIITESLAASLPHLINQQNLLSKEISQKPPQSQSSFQQSLNLPNQLNYV